MNKRIKSILTALITLFLTVGVVYAIGIFNIKTSGIVQEPLEMGSTIDLPSEIWPGVKYPTEVIVNNRNVNGNGDQKIGIIVTKSDRLTYQKICLNTGSGWNCQDGDGWSNTLIARTVSKGGFLGVRAYVVVPGDNKATSTEWVNFAVSREK